MYSVWPVKSGWLIRVASLLIGNVTTADTLPARARRVACSTYFKAAWPERREGLPIFKYFAFIYTQTGTLTAPSSTSSTSLAFRSGALQFSVRLHIDRML